MSNALKITLALCGTAVLITALVMAPQEAPFVVITFALAAMAVLR
jgi:hypothetical protein